MSVILTNGGRNTCVVENNFLPSRIVPKPQPEKSVGMTVNLSSTARSILDGLKEQSGVNKVEVVTRLLEWFGAQGKSVRQAILDSDGDPAGELVRLKMAEMAAAGQELEHMPVERAADLARLAINRLESMGKTYRREAKSAAKT